MRRYLDLLVALSKTKSNMLVDSALHERIQMATMKRERHVPPASVSAIPETPGESVDDTPWNVAQAVEFLGVSPQTVYGRSRNRFFKRERSHQRLRNS